MHPSSVLRPIVLLVPLFGANLACEGPTTSPPAPATSYRSVARGPSCRVGEGQAKVTVVFNARPLVDAMVSSSGRVTSGEPVTLRVLAHDPDRDRLSFAWTSTCPGRFDRKNRAEVTFLCGELTTDQTCTFQVAVSDGKGGTNTGSLVLSSVVPVLNVGPVMGIAYQSSDTPNPGQVVLLHAAASDPEGQPLTWTWKASDGALGKQVDQGEASDVTWTAPATPGVHCTITAIATDPAGASASFDFAAAVVGTGS